MTADEGWKPCAKERSGAAVPHPHVLPDHPTGACAEIIKGKGQKGLMPLLPAAIPFR